MSCEFQTIRVHNNALSVCEARPNTSDTQLMLTECSK